jgi:hypothetical protein
MEPQIVEKLILFLGISNRIVKALPRMYLNIFSKNLNPNSTNFIFHIFKSTTNALMIY